MKKIALSLVLMMLGCASNYGTKDIADYIMKNGSPYEITNGEVSALSYRFGNETDLIFYDEKPKSNLGQEDSLVILFKRKIDTSRFAREGRVVDNGLDGKLELCDPEDECKQILIQAINRL